jgi:hypothetical protein
MDTSALLAQYRPFVQYDSLESYYSDSAAVITDHPGNVLKRIDGTVLAAAAGGGVPILNLAFLRLGTYPSGETVMGTDYIDEINDGYVGAARKMHAKPGYPNKVHGRVVLQNGATWLQYWFFMYYDDPGFLDLGTHEGDIEMIQILLDAAGQPAEVSYAQHRSGVRAPWSEVELKDGAPIVYSARGTHASMLRSGSLRSDRSFLTDHNDARGPCVQLDLVPLSLEQTPWAFWPGHWGGTKPGEVVLGQIGIEANSPAGLTQHGAWQDPASFHKACDPAGLPPVGVASTTDLAAPPQPRLEVQPIPERGVVKVRYTIPQTGGTAASALVIGASSAGDQLPPVTTAVQDPGAAGELEIPLEQGAGAVEVHATTHSPEGGVSDTMKATSNP